MKRKIFWASSIVLVALLVIWVTQALAQKGGKVITRVSAARVVQKEVAAGRSFVGTVSPKRTSIVGSAASGRIEELLVEEGYQVKQGEPLARLRTGIIEAEVAAAQADEELRWGELQENLNGPTPEELDHARAQLASTEAMRVYRKRVRERAIASGRALSSQDRDEAIALADETEAAYLEAKAALTLLENSPRWEKIFQAWARLDSQQAEVRRLQEQLLRHTIVAPFDGYVVAKHAEVGQWVQTGDPVVEVAQLDPVYVTAGVLEDYIGDLDVGAPARVEVTALPNEKPFTGNVKIIVPKADLRTRTFPVKVEVPNRKRGSTLVLKAGLFARVTLPVGTQDKALLVPKDALVLDGSSRQVFVIEPMTPDSKKGKVRGVPVRLGIAEDDQIEVKGDLQADQLVVTEGNERLRPGQEVEIVRIVSEIAE
jgi:HlyD family secretion protein